MLAKCPQLRQRRPVDALSAEHVDVVKLGELFGREGFGRAKRKQGRV
jgi:hypothetical protein